MSDTSHSTSENVLELPAFFALMADFIQLYALNDDPSVLMIHGHHGERGLIAIEGGRIVHAATGTMDGEEAFYRIMRWPKGELHRRMVRQSRTKSVEADLSTLLMNAYDLVSRKGPLSQEDDLLHSPTQKSATMKFSADLVEDPRATLVDGSPYSAHYLRLVWGEALREGLRAIEELISYQVVDIHTERRSLHSPSLDVEVKSLADRLIGALKESDMLEENVELYLSHGESYHAVVSLPTGAHVLHVLFARDESTPAMLQFKLRQVIDRLPTTPRPHPTKKG